MKGFWAVFKREFKSYFATPLAYVFLVVFLFFSAYMTFKGGFFEARQADMSAFFMNLPLLFVFLVPAAAMRLWAEEKKTGSLELLFTLPITVKQAVIGKFMAAWLFLIVALALTFPMVITVCYLGEPDLGLIAVGYIAAILMAGGFLAVGCFFSAISNNQVISFVLSVVACAVLVFAGMPTTMNYLSTFLPAGAVETISKMSFQQHFESIQMGVLQFKDIAYFVLLIAGWIAGCAVVLDENKNLRKAAAVAFVLIIAFSFISISGNAGKNLKADVTEQKIYSLSNGTKAILGKLNQPIRMKLYYSKTAAMKGPDQIRYFNNYYEFVKSLLEEYAAAGKGMVQLEVIDPRPYSDDEVAATRYGLKKFPITEEENFFFGLVVQTQFGVEKTIPVFSPNRQNFVEYDISYLIDTAITRQKKRVGILSSLPVMGDDVTPYMARMMQMQGQQPTQPWGIATQLKQQYELKNIPVDANKIEDVDVLLVIHPKDLSEQTVFAIDQFVINGGRTIVCVDPYSVVDVPPQQQMMQMQMQHDPSSELDKLLAHWGLEMPKNTFAGDMSIAVEAALRQGERPQKIIGYLQTNSECFNKNVAISAELNQVDFLFSGVLKELPMTEEEKKEMNLDRVPLVMTTKQGNSWRVNNQYELMTPDMGTLMKKFTAGTEPVNMGYLVTGKLKSAFPKGIDVETEEPMDANDPNGPKKTQHFDGVAQAAENCAVAVFADVDFISDVLAYRNSFFGTMVVGDNSAMLLNAIDDLCGSSELISIRSRGNFKRPFVVVDDIEAQADLQTAEEENKINAKIAGFEDELRKILSSAQEGQEDLVGNTILQKKKELELNILEAKRQLQEIKKVKLQRKEKLGNTLRNFNMLSAPAVILGISIVLGVYRGSRKRRYISHASDA